MYLIWDIKSQVGSHWNDVYHGLWRLHGLLAWIIETAYDGLGMEARGLDIHYAWHLNGVWMGK